MWEGSRQGTEEAEMGWEQCERCKGLTFLHEEHDVMRFLKDK